MNLRIYDRPLRYMIVGPFVAGIFFPIYHLVYALQSPFYFILLFPFALIGSYFFMAVPLLGAGLIIELISRALEDYFKNTQLRFILVATIGLFAATTPYILYRHYGSDFRGIPGDTVYVLLALGIYGPVTAVVCEYFCLDDESADNLKRKIRAFLKRYKTAVRIVIAVICLMLFVSVALPLRSAFHRYQDNVAHNADLLRYHVPIELPERLFTSDDDSVNLLFRYLMGNPFWVVRELDGKIYAQTSFRIDEEYKRHQEYKSKYAAVGGGLVSSKTREYPIFYRGPTLYVTIELSEEIGNGERDRSSVTYVNPGDVNADLFTVEAGYKYTPVLYTSTLQVRGKKLTFEIRERNYNMDRTFTKSMLIRLNDELQAVDQYAEEIRTTGRIPDNSFYPYAPVDEPSFIIDDENRDGGIFQLEAQLQLKSSGYVETRVFDVETNSQLSEERLGPRSRRHVGWSESGESFFEYNTDFTVYEGDWSEKYLARFELWHVTPQGELKVAEQEKMINGWQR